MARSGFTYSLGRKATGGGGTTAGIHSFLRVDPDYISDRFLDALVTAAEGATQVMEKVVETETTPTGDARAARGGQPGRIETRAMIESLRGEDGSPVTVTKRNTKAGRLSVKFGFQNNAPDYTVYQETPGRNPSIKGMLAHQFGMNHFLQHVIFEMAEAAVDVGKSMLGERLARRAIYAGVRPVKDT